MMLTMLYDDVEVICDELNNPISIDEVLKAINGCKSEKSHGEDLLLNEFLKYGQHILAAPLSKLFWYSAGRNQKGWYKNLETLSHN